MNKRIERLNGLLTSKPPIGRRPSGFHGFCDLPEAGDVVAEVEVMSDLIDELKRLGWDTVDLDRPAAASLYVRLMSMNDALADLLHRTREELAAYLHPHLAKHPQSSQDGLSLLEVEHEEGHE